MINVIQNKCFSKNDSLAGVVYHYGIRSYGKNISIDDNYVRIVHTRPTGRDTGILANARAGKQAGSVNRNTVDIDVASAGSWTRGIHTYGQAAPGRVAHDNTITLDNSDTTNNHECLYIEDKYNSISINTLNGVNNNAKDIGIKMPVNADNNDGIKNVIINCGTEKTDFGSGNTINVVDGGSF